jgi:hypothetical protein
MSMIRAATGPNLSRLRAIAPTSPISKVATVIVVAAALLLTGAFLHTEQADSYGNPHVIAVLRQLVYETPFQPLFLVVALLPLLIAAARGARWRGLLPGALLMVAALLPFARFAVVDVHVGPQPGLQIDGQHNSLFQLAGPGHEMPQFVSAVTLFLMAGVVTMFWQPRVGGLIGLLGVISLAFVWNAVLDDPPFEKIFFLDRDLRFGYYIAWTGAVLAFAWEWLEIAARRYLPAHSSDASPELEQGGRAKHDI